MTLEQIARLTKTLDDKVEEGLLKLETTQIDSQTYTIVLNNIITSTQLANKIRMDRSPLESTTESQTTKGDN